MSELAYNLAGDPFDVPEGAAAWRVRRMKAQPGSPEKAQRGAPEVVYGLDGAPLTVSIDAGIDELRAAVNHAPGRYRLEPVDDNGKTLADAPVGYVYVHPSAAPATPGPNLAALQAFATLPAAPTLPAASDSVAIEMLRMHTEGMREAFRSTAQIASAVVAAFPSVMGATGTVLAAADGAGLPARMPRVIDVEAVELEAGADEDEDEDDTPSRSPLVQFGNAIAAQLMPLMPILAPALTQKLGGMLGVPVQTAPVQSKPATIAAPNPATVAPSASTTALDPTSLVKLAPIYMQLAPAERLRATTLAAELTPTEQAAFAEQLAAMTPEDALAKVRELVGEEDA